MKAAAIRELDWAIGTLRIAHDSIVEHVGIVRWSPYDTNKDTNKLCEYQQIAAHDGELAGAQNA